MYTHEIIICTLHVSAVVFLSFYCFIFKQGYFDYLFLLFSYLTILHWTFLNGECLATYTYKKLKNPEYIAGMELKKCELNDVLDDNNITRFVIITNLFAMLNIYVISKRNKIPSFIYLSYIIIFETYFFGISFFKDHHMNETFFTFQETIKYLLIFIAIVFFFYKKN